VKPEPVSVSNVSGPLAATADGEAEDSKGAGEIIVAETEAERVGSASLVAVTVGVLGEGGTGGAVYRPPASIVPREAFPPTIPFTDQVTAWFELPVTVAAKLCVCPTNTVGLEGATATTNLTVRFAEFEIPPPGGGFTTWTGNAPAVAS